MKKVITYYISFQQKFDSKCRFDVVVVASLPHKCGFVSPAQSDKLTSYHRGMDICKLSVNGNIINIS